MEAELAGLLDQYENVTDLGGRQAVVRNGYLPERDLLTGLGPVPVRIPKVRDRTGSGSNSTRRWYRRMCARHSGWKWRSVAVLARDFDGDMREALSVLLGDEAQGLSPAVVSRLKAEWVEAYAAWNRRDLSDEHYVYVWADGVIGMRGEGL